MDGLAASCLQGLLGGRAGGGSCPHTVLSRICLLASRKQSTAQAAQAEEGHPAARPPSTVLPKSQAPPPLSAGGLGTSRFPPGP